MSEQAIAYRMVTPDHLCPWGFKTKELLERNGYEVEDHASRSDSPPSPKTSGRRAKQSG